MCEDDGGDCLCQLLMCIGCCFLCKKCCDSNEPAQQPAQQTVIIQQPVGQQPGYYDPNQGQWQQPYPPQQPGYPPQQGYPPQGMPMYPPQQQGPPGWNPQQPNAPPPAWDQPPRY